MKIAIAADGVTPDAQVSQHGARAPFYLMYDEKGHLQQAIANPCANAERGAGPKAAQFLLQQGVQILVAGEFGGRFAAELEADGIQQVQMAGQVADVITEVLAQ